MSELLESTLKQTAQLADCKAQLVCLKAAAKSLVDEVASHTLSQGRFRNAVYADGVVCRVATLEALRKLVESPECRHDSEVTRILCSRITDMETMESKAVMDWIAEVKQLRAKLEVAKAQITNLLKVLPHDCEGAARMNAAMEARESLAQLNAEEKK